MKTFYVLFSLLCFILPGKAQVPKDSIIAIDKNKPAGDSVFTKVEKEVTFPGGEMAWRTYLQNNLDPFVPVKNNAPDGTYKVIVRFIVNRDGFISDVKAETSFGYGMEGEAMRIIKKMPKWMPSNKDGASVKAYCRQPITFVIQSK